MSGSNTPPQSAPLQGTPLTGGALAEGSSGPESHATNFASSGNGYSRPLPSILPAGRASYISVSSETDSNTDEQNMVPDLEAQFQIRDRKRRLTSTSDRARLPRTYSSGAIGPDDGGKPGLLHRSESEFQPGTQSLRPQAAGTSYATPIDITSSPSEDGPGATASRVMPDHSQPSPCETGSGFHPMRRYQTWHSPSPGSNMEPGNRQSGNNASRKPLPWAPPPRRSSQNPSGDAWPRQANEHATERFPRNRLSGSAAGFEDMMSFSNQTELPVLSRDSQPDERWAPPPRQTTLETFGWGVRRSEMGSEDSARTILSSPGGGVSLRPEMEDRSGAFPEYSDGETPRWQPDEEVSSCPICGTVFNFWHRKHHCRKCGRVVCASCSPHFIVIPRQYIVRPPDSLISHPHSSPVSQPPVVDLTSDDLIHPFSAVVNPALGGGEKVRLCNPCVPDPNPNPLGYGPSHVHTHRSTHSLNSMGRRHSRVAQETASPRQERRTLGSNDRPSGLPGQGQSVRRSVTITAVRQPPADGETRAAVAPRRPAVSEEDLCPVCGRIFPTLGNGHTQEAREEHIRECIANFGASPTVQEPSPHMDLRQAPPPPPSSSLPAAPRMLSFTASEKDCLGEDGGVGECSICFEDYEAGQTLARLNCLCKFHRACIIDWFERKMECPVHKV